MPYPHKCPPFAHQERALRYWSRPAYALFWEQGTGKTKTAIDHAACLHKAGKINGALVIAPPGVELNWMMEELPTHWPDLPNLRNVFLTAKKHTKNHKALMNRSLTCPEMSWLMISYPAALTAEGKKTIDKFLNQRDVLLILDESHKIKTPGSKTTKRLRALGRRADYRRILTGTPITKWPLDVYSQTAFLDEFFWKNAVGVHNFAEFKARFAYIDNSEGYPRILGYRDQDELASILATIGDRVLKKDVLDLPPKLYSKARFYLTEEQLRAYHALANDPDDDRLAIVKLTEFQKIACGHDFSPNPRIKALSEIVEGLHHQAIIWARYTADVDQIMELLAGRAARYDGKTADPQAEKSAFVSGDRQFLVGTAAKGGEGISLPMAKTMIYYGNTFNLAERLQSEDRAHRAGMDSNPLHVIDVMAEDVGVDRKIIAALRAKRDIASSLLGDDVSEWI